MTAKEIIKYEMDMALSVLKTYLSDLTDADLLKRPVPGMNHLAWQLGHLIRSESDLLNGVCPGSAAELPASFAAAYTKETAASDDHARFLSKQQYIDLYDRQRAASKAALDQLPESELDKPAPEHFRKYCPTVGTVFSLIGTHPLMHSGQFVALRRLLGKPVLI